MVPMCLGQVGGGEGELLQAGRRVALSLAAAGAHSSEPWWGCSPGEWVWPPALLHTVGNLR